MTRSVRGLPPPVGHLRELPLAPQMREERLIHVAEHLVVRIDMGLRNVEGGCTPTDVLRLFSLRIPPGQGFRGVGNKALRERTEHVLGHAVMTRGIDELVRMYCISVIEEVRNTDERIAHLEQTMEARSAVLKRFAGDVAGFHDSFEAQASARDQILDVYCATDHELAGLNESADKLHERRTILKKFLTCLPNALLQGSIE